MIIETTGLIGVKSELAHLDDCMQQAGFVRWQWEYTRATYDCKISENKEDYYLRVNTRAIEGKLESPFAVLVIEHVYIGVATFPHGLDYSVTIPDNVMRTAKEKLAQLEQLLK